MQNGNKLILFFLLFLATSNFAHNLSSEADISVYIDENNFGYTHEVEANEYYYLKVRIIDENSIPLDNYHLHFIVEDARGAIVNDYSEAALTVNGNLVISRILSDANGFVYFSFPVNPCNATQTDFCYEIDETYTFRIIQKGLDRREKFFVSQQQLEHDWIGQSLRWLYINANYLFIVGILIIITLALLATFYWLLKSRRK